MSDRPSFMQVDRWHVAGDPRVRLLHDDPEWGAHLATLEPLPLPPWLASLPARRPSPQVWPLILVAATALVAAWAFQAPYVAWKGGPELIVYVRTANGAAVWDGHTPLGEGDQIQLEVRGTSGFTLVYEDDGVQEVLAEAPRPGLIERAWALDGPAAGDRLLVVGSDGEPVVVVVLR